jgi:4-amino-4-deoxychorismate lyase
MQHTLCIETIAVKNRQFKNIEYHEARLNKTRKELWGYSDYWKLEELINIPNNVSHDLHKCRLAYGEKIDNIRWEPYTPRTIRKIRIVHHNTVDYSFKYDQRPQLNDLYAQRGDADEILIIKKGMVTDSFYCNVAFLDGEDWYTPKTYLLPGTQRALLLDSGVIREADISEKDIQKFSHIKLFNAMLGWDLASMLPIGMVD